MEKIESENLGNFIGEGGEKKVYEDKNNPDLVIGLFKEEWLSEYEKSSRFLKARYYLTKIMHILFPQNMPDMHQASLEPHSVLIDRIKDPQKPSSFFKRRKKDTPDREKILEFARKFSDFGVTLDGDDSNFKYDNKDNIQYVDTLMPWIRRVIFHKSDRKIEFRANFDESQIRKSLEELNDENSKNLGLGYLDRLKQLYKEEVAEINKDEGEL